MNVEARNSDAGEGGGGGVCLKLCGNKRMEKNSICTCSFSPAWWRCSSNLSSPAGALILRGLSALRLYTCICTASFNTTRSCSILHSQLLAETGFMHYGSDSPRPCSVCVVIMSLIHTSAIKPDDLGFWLKSFCKL